MNFAFGGASTGLFNPAPGGMTVPGLKGPVSLFGLALGGRRPSPHALYTILAGANDYLSLTRIKPSQESGLSRASSGTSPINPSCCTASALAT